MHSSGLLVLASNMVSYETFFSNIGHFALFASRRARTGTGADTRVPHDVTVREHAAGSHAKHGWEQFTDAVVRTIAERKDGVVYMLWGNYAQRKGSIADPTRNLILKTAHPSPLSVYRGFFGCKHFSQANAYLRSIGKSEIIW